MTTISDFHSSGVEDGDELVYHNQRECAPGQAIANKGTAVPGRGYYRTLCPECRALLEGYRRVDPL